MSWLLVLGLVLAAQADPEAVKKLVEQAGIPSTPTKRGQFDVVGFASRADQMESVLRQTRELAAPRNRELETAHGWTADTAFAAAVCPHDDYYYAARLYGLVLPRVKAKRLVLFGVFHKARLFDCRDRLVFDNFQFWHGPAGWVPVSPLRQELLARLPAGDVVVDNTMHTVEHSLEAFVPYLQADRPDVEIVPILVPYMGWETMDRLATDFSTALAVVMKENGWELGRDVAVVCSTDAVHYGDSQWGGTNYCPFGSDAAGYLKAVAQDRSLIDNFLAGPVKEDKLKDFLYLCVDQKDVTRYTITWCGRFSVPFGLLAADRTARALGRPGLTGVALDYGTSVSEASLDLTGLGLMGVTAPNNLHHWVGYAALGYE
jgi:AmmeMemoRadiSam system protein B